MNDPVLTELFYDDEHLSDDDLLDLVATMTPDAVLHFEGDTWWADPQPDDPYLIEMLEAIMTPLPTRDYERSFEPETGMLFRRLRHVPETFSVVNIRAARVRVGGRLAW